MTDDELKSELDRRFTGVAELIHQLGQHLDERFGQVNTRFDVLEARMDRLDTRMVAMEIQMAGLNRWQDQSGQSLSRVDATQQAQQKAIDELAARVAKLEQSPQ
jgi:chromosome segregation ATPase